MTILEDGSDERQQKESRIKSHMYPVSLLVLRAIHSALDLYQGLCTGRGGQQAVALLFFTSITNPRLPLLPSKAQLSRSENAHHI